MEKKGSHVGIMLSFVIFVTFLVFLYSVIQPIIKTGQEKKISLDSLKIELVIILDPDLTSYSSGSIKSLDENFMVTLNQLATDYNSDYEALKTELKVSAGNEFGFEFVNTEEVIEVTTETNIPGSVNVYVERIPVYYIGGETNVLLGFLNLKVW